MSEYVIGLDIGTTSVKACIFKLNGTLIAEAEKINKTYYPFPGWVEQNPDEIERSSVQVVRDAIEKAHINNQEIISMGFSAAMHSLICVGEADQPLSRALIWADGRSCEQAEKINPMNSHTIFSHTGTPLHPMTPFVKLLWMREKQYGPYRNARYFMSIKEYLILRWFGQRVIDYSMASATGLFNPMTRQWEDDLLYLTGVHHTQLSEIVPPTKVLCGMKRAVADAMGISREMPCVVGAADGQLANLGIGAILPGEVAVTVGTSGAIRQLVEGVKIDNTHKTFCYSFTEDYSIIGGPTNNGGIVLQWLKELLNYEESYDKFLAEAESVGAGAEGLVFLPYINGERAPLWSQRAKGNFYGVSVFHKKEHFVRAALEGITFNLYQIGRELERLAGRPTKLFVNGGLARSSLWLQILADVFGTDIYVPQSYHGSAWGAAWVALVGIQMVDSLEAIKRNVPMGQTVVPIDGNFHKYKRIYQEYETLTKDIGKYFESPYQ